MTVSSPDTRLVQLGGLYNAARALIADIQGDAPQVGGFDLRRMRNLTNDCLSSVESLEKLSRAGDSA